MSTRRESIQSSTPSHLLARARAGDLHSLDRLLAGQRTDLLRLVRLRLGARMAARVDAEDLFQDASIQAMRSITTLRSEEPAGFRRWFLGIVRHRIWALAKSGRARVRPRRDAALPDAHLEFQDPAKLESPQSPTQAMARGRGHPPLRRLFVDGRMSLVLHEVFASGWDTVAFLLDRPSLEAARQVHLRTRARVES